MVATMEIPDVFVEVGEELVTEEAALPVAEVDGLDVASEVGGEDEGATLRTGGEAEAVY